MLDFVNFLSSQPIVGVQLGRDGLQLQARTARGSGGWWNSVCTAAQNLLCPCIAAAAEYDQGTAATQSRPEVENNRRAAIGDRPP